MYLLPDQLELLAKTAYDAMLHSYLTIHPDYGGANKECLAWEQQCRSLREDWAYTVHKVLREAERVVRLRAWQPGNTETEFQDGVP